MSRTRATRRARTAAVKASNYRRAHLLWGDDNLALQGNKFDPMAHSTCGRSKCHYCADAWLPERQIARLDAKAADILSDWFDVSA